MKEQLLKLVKTLCPLLFYTTIYEEQCNPEIWPGLCQTGLRQSPIDIISDKATGLLVQDRLIYNNYNNLYDIITISNDGSSISANFNGTVFKPSVTYRNEIYELINVHFHWGASEHSINGKSYAGEVHLVHRSSNQNILVLGALLEETIFSPNILSWLIGHCGQSITKAGTFEKILTKETPFEEILKPINLNKYFFYQGSLTTPKCNEDVLWFVFQETLKVDALSIRSLQNVEGKNGKKLTFTNRKIQQLNNRSIYKS